MSNARSNAQHIRDLHTLPEPAKSLALKFARSRSLADATALHGYVFNETNIRPLSCYYIAAIIPHSLDPIPEDLTEITEESKPLVDRTRLLLEVLSRLAYLLQSSDEYYSMLATYVLSHHDRVFPWWDFLQHHYFGRSDPGLIAAEDERVLSISLSFILRLVLQVLLTVDRTEHYTIGTMVIHIWHKLLRMDSIYSRSDEHLQYIVLAVDKILLMFLLTRNFTRDSPPPQIPQYIMDAVGGPSAVIAFTLARMERDILYISPQLDGTDIPYVGLRGCIVNLSAFAGDPLYVPQLMEQRVIKRTINILKQVIARGPPPSMYPLSNPPISAQIIHLCIGFICLCPNWGPEEVKEILESRFISILRTTKLQPLQITVQSMQSLPLQIICHFCYPFIIKRSKRHAPPTESSGPPKLWDLYDAYCGAYGYLWDRAGSMARIFDHCATCKATESDCHLKVCAGCRVAKYCSSECQRLAWEGDHKINCLMFRCSHPDQATVTNCRDFLYLAFFEHFALQEPSIRIDIESVLTWIHDLPRCDQDEIPVVRLVVNPCGSAVDVGRMEEFPNIFGTSEWRRNLLPKFRQLASTGRLKHLTMMTCPIFKGRYILGALTSTIASGMVDGCLWDQEAENFESRRPKIWPRQWELPDMSISSSGSS